LLRGVEGSAPLFSPAFPRRFSLQCLPITFPVWFGHRAQMHQKGREFRHCSPSPVGFDVDHSGVLPHIAQGNNAGVAV
jgi:hypothetical protein